MNKIKSNYFAVNRELLFSDRWLSEPFTRGQAWVDLFGLAQHDHGYFMVRGNRVDVVRGQLAYSQCTLGKRWRWSRSKVRRYLVELEKRGDIRQQNTSVTTIITIIKYDLWQGRKTTDDTTERQQKDNRKTTDDTTERQQKDNRRYTYNNDKNDKNDKNDNNKTLAPPSGGASLTSPLGGGLPSSTALTIQAGIVDTWKETYKMATGHDYNADRKDYVQIAGLAKKYGEAAVVEKARILFCLCESKSAWFTKDGFADFTVPRLVKHWNNILETTGETKKEAELRKIRADGSNSFADLLEVIK